MNPEVPPEEDQPTALTYEHWMQALDIMAEHEACDYNTRELAKMVKALFQINRHDPETIGYMNARAREAMEMSEQ